MYNVHTNIYMYYVSMYMLRISTDKNSIDSSANCIHGGQKYTFSPFARFPAQPVQWSHMQ